MMDAPLFASEPPESAPQRPRLPLPKLKRWQPLRLGLVELYHYDSEEFWFRDGHLLLRGNNGTGKSKVLSLTLPFLLDAQIKPSRIEPDGDAGKRMGWNLLMGQHPRRLGYAWLEFGRLGDDGQPQHLTLGAGLLAVEGRPQVEAWYFIVEDAADAPRLNRDLWLVSEQKVVLTKERLREALGGRGQLFETARSYRRAVDERLFRLGAQRYDALMDTLIQLRQPQLSKKPGETALSNALSEALPPLPQDLISDVADALSQLDEDRRQLEEYQALARAVVRFEQRYRIYAGTRSRREAAGLRNAQTEHDNASRARNEAQALLKTAEAEEAGAKTAHEDAELALKRAQARPETLRADPANQDANRLQESVRESESRRRAVVEAQRDVDKAELRARRDAEERRHLAQRVGDIEARLAGAQREGAVHAGTAGIAAAFALSPLATAGADALLALTAPKFEQGQLRPAHAGCRAAQGHRLDPRAPRRGRHRRGGAGQAPRGARRSGRCRCRRRRRSRARPRRRRRRHAGAEPYRRLGSPPRAAQPAGGRPAAGQAAVAALGEWVHTLDDDNPPRRLLEAARDQHSRRSAQRRAALDGRREELESERAALQDERSRLESGVDAAPPAPHTRAVDVRAVRAGAPLWQLVDFAPCVGPADRAGLEAALEASGLLDAWLAPDGLLQADADGKPILDVQALPRGPCQAPLGAWLQAELPDGCPVPATVVSAVLAGIVCTTDDPGDCEVWVTPDGRFRLSALAGAWTKPEPAYIGFAARAAARARRLAAIAEHLTQLAAGLAEVQAAAEQLERDDRQAAEEWRSAPTDDALRQAHLVAATRAHDAQTARARLAEADIRYRDAEQVA